MSNHETPLAQLYTNRRISQTETWPVHPDELRVAGRETRSSHSEIIYRLGDQQIEYHTPTRVQLPLQPGPSTLREEGYVESPTRQHLNTPVVDVQPTPTRQPTQSPIPSAPPVIQNPNPQPDIEQGDLNQENQQLLPHPPDIEMADNTVLPPPFTGKPSENPNDWFRQFVNYCQYKDLPDQKRVDLFKVILAGAAADWLETLDAQAIRTIADVKTAFDGRYKTPNIVKFKSAREIFSRKQGQDETSDDYITQMTKLGKIIQADEKMMRYAILNGLRSEIATYVTQQNPTNIDQLLAAARVAELTMPSQSTHDSALHAKVDRLVDSWEKMSVNPIRDNRSPTPTRKRVTFTPADRQSPTNQPWTRRPFRSNSPYPRAQFTEQTGPRFRSGAPRGQFQRQQPIRPPQTQSSQTGCCPKCGHIPHLHPNYCLAINQTCRACGKRGHFAAVCRSRTKQQGPRTFKYE